MKRTSMKSFVLSLALFLCFIMSMSGVVSASAVSVSSFEDVDSSHWAYDFIDDAVQRGLFAGTSSTTFEPETTMSRAMFVTVLSHLDGVSVDNSVSTRFADVESGTWYTGAVAWAANNGITSGTSSTTFSPNDPVTREQMATLIVHYAAVADVDLPEYFETGTFSDASSISSWAKDAVAACQRAGIMVGVGENIFAPLDVSTRAQAATVFSRFTSAIAPYEGLKAGAGVGEIDLTELFDTENGGPFEGFYGVNDNPYARVLVLETNEKIAIVSLELVACPDVSIETCKDVVSELTGTPRENIWIHVTHAITTPHIGGTDTQQAMFLTAIETAITEAAQQAADTFQPAVAGADTGYCDVNANRNVYINGRYYYGLGSTYGASDKDLTILRVDSASTGQPIGFLINYAMKPDAINNTQQSVNGRLVSSDVPGYVCTYMEEEFGAPALYLMGAAADQVPKKTADYYVADPDTGEATRIQLSVDEGLAIVNELGTEMGDIAIEIAEGISCTESSQTIALDSDTISWPNKDATTGTVDATVMQFGNLALVGLKPELNALSGLQLKEASPFGTTMIVSFLDGGQKYLPDAQAYEDNTWEVSRTNFAAGAAEEFVRTAIELLNGLKMENG